MNLVRVDYERDNLISDFSRELLKKHYCLEGETPQDAYARAAHCFSLGDHTLAQHIYDYVSKGWFMFSSPILSNAVEDGVKPKGLPISCFLTYVDDSIKGLCDHTTEERWLSVKGGGVGGHWSDVRSTSDVTPGVNGFLHTVDADMSAYRQGKTRRGSYAAYLDVSHPEIVEFIKMRIPTGDLNRKNLNLHHGVNITADFIAAVDHDFDWYLVDPHTDEVVEIVKARELWEEILTTRFRTGEPYINYIDEANDKMHPALKAAGLEIHGSNLCNEIHLPTSTDRTAVCCLSSVNLAKYDEWKDTAMVQDLIYFLDNVLQFFIDHAPDELSKAKFSAEQERSLGLGAMGFHDYLQSKNIPWDSAMAISTNRNIFKNIQTQAKIATRELAAHKGEPQLLTGTEERNAHLLAIAPNANSSIILGVSSSVEPRASNCYTHKTRVGSYLVKNPYLERVLKEHDQDNREVWDSIMAHNGSVQHLEFLTQDTKDVYKTAMELDQRWVVDMARARQEFICQGQSVNLFFPVGAHRTYVNNVHRRAFSANGLGDPLKGLYYLRTESAGKVEKVNVKIERDKLQDGIQGDLNECIACQG
jgi:ribonucleoside-diphosphate reductase alpha chain